MKMMIIGKNMINNVFIVIYLYGSVEIINIWKLVENFIVKIYVNGWNNYVKNFLKCVININNF